MELLNPEWYVAYRKYIQMVSIEQNKFGYLVLLQGQLEQ